MRWILETIKEPILTPDSVDFTELNDTFGLPKGDTGKPWNICLRVLNYGGPRANGFGKVYGKDDNKSVIPTWPSVANFMNSIQDYMPKKLQSSNERLWNRLCYYKYKGVEFAEETARLLDEMVNWMITMKEKIQDMLTSEYFIKGNVKDLEILKRRYKDNWSEKTEQKVEADVSSDNSIQIEIRGFDEEDYQTDETSA